MGGEGRAGISAERRHPLSHMSPQPPPGRSQSHPSCALGPDGSKVLEPLDPEAWFCSPPGDGAPRHQVDGLPAA